MIARLKRLGVIATCCVALTGISGCQFQPLYGSYENTVGRSGVSLSKLYVAEVDTREAQQVRNHLIFLLNGGASPLEPSHTVNLRVSSINTTLASATQNLDSLQIGNTAGNVRVTVSYEIFDEAKKEVIFRGTREARASYDKTSQSFATARATRDAENRAAKEVAEQLRLAIAANFNSLG